MLLKFLLSDVNTFKVTESHFVWHEYSTRREMQDHFLVQCSV